MTKNVYSGASEFDQLRRKYLKALATHTGRPVIAYTSAWTSHPNGGGPNASLTPEDLQGFMEVVHGIPGDQLDLILHSPGGSAEATEAVVMYLRQKFKNIRAIIPQAAMSAATMLACACDEIILGNHSAIGPIDPQMITVVDGQIVQAPAAAIREQFAQAQKEIKADPSLLPSWIPMLRQYGPALLAQCRYAEALSKELVREWLTKWMFAGDADVATKASTIAENLASHANFNSHGRFIGRDKAKSLGFGSKIVELEQDQKFQDLVLSVFHAATITHTSTPTIKIIENSLGRAYVKSEQVIFNIQQAQGQPKPPTQPPPSPAQT